MIGLRAIKIAAGGPAVKTEALRMVTEKLDAALTLQRKALTGALGFDAPGVTAGTLAHYRSRVKANRRRLSQ